MIKFLYWNSLQYCMFLLSCLVLDGLLPKREINTLSRVSTVILRTLHRCEIYVSSKIKRIKITKCLIYLYFTLYLLIFYHIAHDLARTKYFCRWSQNGRRFSSYSKVIDQIRNHFSNYPLKLLSVSFLDRERNATKN